MHPGSANDVSANADERKNTTVRSALRALNFFFSCSSRDTLKIIYSFFLPNSHTDTKIRRKHAHVKNDASTSTHFHAHPYTRKRIRDCNLNVLNMSHKNTCILHINILSTYFLGRGFVCLQKKRRYYRRTTNDIEREKDTNERRNMIEEELRAFDDEGAFASPMDCDNFYENEFSSLLLEGKKTEEEPHRAGSSDTLLTATLGLSGRLNGLQSAEFSRTRVRENRKCFHLGAGGFPL